MIIIITEMCAFGLLHDLLGVFFLTAKPYKKNWMNHLDRLFLGLVGVVLMILLIFVVALVL